MTRLLPSLAACLTVVGFCSAQSHLLKPRACTFTWPANEGDTCASMVSNWGITEEQFQKWNPSVDCDKELTAGDEYCIEWEETTPTSTTSTPATTTTSTPTGPSPTRTGIIDSCTSFHKVVEGDSCQEIIDQYGTFSLEDFYKWNSAVGDNCSGLWLGYYVCVGVPGTPTSPPATTTTTAAPSGPSPTQTGIIDTCTNFHKAVEGDSCVKIVDQYGTFSLEDFYEWNPAIGEGCSGLWLGYYYCVGVPGTPTQPPTTLITTTTTPSGPSPTQPGIDLDCKEFYKVKTGDTCETIADDHNIDLADFYDWNTSVGEDCGSLWLDYYVCVAV